MWYHTAAASEGREIMAKDRKVKLLHILVRRLLMSVLLRQKHSF